MWSREPGDGQVLRGLRPVPPEEPIHIRICLHCGEAIRDEDKFFGKTVIHAFRVADLAASEEILVSGHLQSPVADRGFRFSDEREVTLKGFSGTHPIAQIEWRAAGFARSQRP